jgi:hypothetical protein
MTNSERPHLRGDWRLDSGFGAETKKKGWRTGSGSAVQARPYRWVAFVICDLSSVICHSY